VRVTLRGGARIEGSTKGASLRTAAFLGGIRDGAEEVKASSVREGVEMDSKDALASGFLLQAPAPGSSRREVSSRRIFGGSKGFPASRAHSVFGCTVELAERCAQAQPWSLEGSLRLSALRKERPTKVDRSLRRRLISSTTSRKQGREGDGRRRRRAARDEARAIDIAVRARGS